MEAPPPPQLAQRFLLWFLKKELAEEVIGDMEEQYYEQLATTNTNAAKRHYWYQVLNYLRPFAIRSDLFNSLNPFFMLRSYYQLAWRNLLKNKLNSLINLMGMSIGMTCFILIGLYIQYEASFDLQHPKGKRIYRIAQTQKGNEFRGSDQFAIAPMTIGPALKEKFPEVEAATTLTIIPTLLWNNEQTWYQKGLYADEHLFEVFSYPVIEGNAVAALKNLDAIILTESLAKKYFDSSSPIGKTIKLSDDRLLTVQAVIEDLPSNQHFHFDFIVSIENYGEYREDRANWRWESNNYLAYIVLKEGFDYRALEEKMTIFDAAVTAAYQDLPFRAEYFLQPLHDIHLYSQLNAEDEANGDIRYLYLAGSIALIILLLALINYMNLTNASFSQRIKEMGVRKVLGAKKRQLIHQLITESLLVSSLSFFLSIGFAYLLLPGFNRLMDLPVTFELLSHKTLFLALFGTILTFGILSGLYPALLAASITSVNALKGSWHKSHQEGSFFRGALLVGQFTTAIVLAISSVFVYQQLQYIQHKKLSFQDEQIVYLPYRNQAIFDKTQTLRSELTKYDGITDVSIASSLPLNNSNLGIIDSWEGHTDQQELYIYRLHTDQHFLDLFDLELIEGRNFSTDFPTDTLGAYLLNEAAVKALGWSTATGKSFRDGQVIGVVKNFHFQPFDSAIEPMYITYYKRKNVHFHGNITLKMKADQAQQTIAQIQQTIKEILPEMPFDLQYFDESYKQLYAKETRFGEAFNISTLLALFIACMGLLGLVAHHVLLRTKEIGIRKVLGASARQIIQLIARDFLKPVLVAALLAVPIAWWMMNRWLQHFVYHIDMAWWVFVLVGVAAVFIALATIGFKSLKAALANPVDTIKTD